MEKTESGGGGEAGGSGDGGGEGGGGGEGEGDGSGVHTQEVLPAVGAPNSLLPAGHVHVESMGHCGVH